MMFEVGVFFSCMVVVLVCLRRLVGVVWVVVVFMLVFFCLCAWFRM